MYCYEEEEKLIASAVYVFLETTVIDKQLRFLLGSDRWRALVDEVILDEFAFCANVHRSCC